jgi:hypothetical protein
VDIHLVRREAKIPHGQIKIRKGPVNQRLQPRVMLLPIRQTASHDGDVIALFQGNQWLCGKQRAPGGNNEGGNAQTEERGIRDHDGFWQIRLKRATISII